MDDLIRTQLDADGVLLALIDMPGRTMNVFSVDLMDALQALMDRVDSDPAVQSCVLISGKPGFLAGADLEMVRGYCDAAKHSSHEAMFAMCGRLGRMFVRIEASAKPWVAAVNGLAMGGGLELALACRVRLVNDDPRILLGVPEVRWGLLPGAGGTQRLPRLVGFDAALDLLLSGRSLAPFEAVRLGLFARALPAAQLLEQAKAEARAQQGRPYDASAKFAQLGQRDVPQHSAAAARDLAIQHGVGPDDFDAYPAYSAIVDSVLKGARLPLDQATDVEMNQFLRLMFSPVAGRMVRTLFLERLRAERELAAPQGLLIERIGVGAISPMRAAWSQALGKLKIAQAPDAALQSDTLSLWDHQGSSHHIALRVLEDDPRDQPAGAAGNAPWALLAPAGPYGRVLEIIGAESAGTQVAAALAARMRCLPWRTPGPHSALQSMRGLALPEQAEQAQRLVALPGAGDPAFLDVAACLSGIAPAWSGGPLGWSHEERVPARSA